MLGATDARRAVHDVQRRMKAVPRLMSVTGSSIVICA
jgi:hypothetical protein